ncbi:MAG: hypothetical protein A2231_08380 [Candidatus Firestonebacteria bacterium RIFOXYA2_FULL_40_8]|nr:MAG: hypothetical protein A2231_08380 [Candidatus Firestonebacteria bacterium RIFOXYA2_FULL_40_8]
MRKLKDLFKNKLFIKLGVTALLLFIGIALFYINFRLADYAHDSIVYSMTIEKKIMYAVYHAHHLYYNIYKMLLLDVLKTFGYTGGALLLSQIYNSILGAAGIGFLFLTVYYITKDYVTSLLSGLFVASCFGYWYDSTFAGVRMGVVFLIPLFLMLVLYMRNEKVPVWKDLLLVAGMGILHGFVVLLHQTHAMFGIVVLAAFLLKKETWPKKAMFFSIYCTVFLLIVAGMYYHVAYHKFYIRSMPEFKKWFISYATLGYWGFFNNHSVSTALWGIRKMITGELPDGAKLLFGVKNIVIIKTLLYIPAFFTVYLLAFSFRVFKKYWKELTLSFVWLILYCIFFTWWEPGNFEFWIYPLPAAVFIMAIAISDFLDLWKKEKIKLIWKTFFAATVSAGILVLFLYNLQGSILPMSNKENIYAYHILEEAKRLSDSENDLFFVSEDNIPHNLDYYLKKKNTTPLSSFEKAKGNEDQAYRIMDESIKKTLESGNKVFLMSTIANETEIKNIWIACPSASKERFYSFFTGNYSLAPQYYSEKKYYFWEVGLK